MKIFGLIDRFVALGKRRDAVLAVDERDLDFRLKSTRNPVTEGSCCDASIVIGIIGVDDTQLDPWNDFDALKN